jgi:GMP synthase-like glutamine amidotransferase
MKIGILDVNPPHAHSVDWNKTPFDAYVRFLERAKPSFEYENYALVSEGKFPSSPETCDAYLITGSPKGVYEDDAWLVELKTFIQDAYKAGKKLIGICFGHQMIAHSLGGHVEKSKKGWGLGKKDFNLYTEKKWMTDFIESPSLYFVHQDQVMELPPKAELLGGNEFCPNLFYTIGDQVLGIQGHPEFPEALVREIIETRLEVVGAELQAKALRSLDESKPNNQLFAEWIVNFLLT